MTADLLADVLALHARGFAVIPVPYKEKAPVTHAWQDLRLDETGMRTAFSRRSNVGVLLGAPSNGLTDVDLDCPEALALALFLLPPTDLRSGRPSAPDSHRYYRVSAPLKTTKFNDPLGRSGDDRSMLVELRSTGVQTLVPPSVHPSGEPLAWAQNEDPEEVDATVLQRAVARLAAGALLARYWPTTGSRHEAALALGGGLLRAGWDEDEAAAFIGHVTGVAGDEEAEDRRQAVHSTAGTLAAGQHTTGWPTLKTLVDHRVVDTIRKWLGITDRGDGIAGSGAAGGPHHSPAPFPVDVFPPAIAAFVQRGAAAFGIPPDFIAIPLLGFIAGVIGHLRAIELKPGWTERAILWTGVVGRPGSGKSPGMDYAQQLINDLQYRAWSTYQTELDAWKGSQQPGKVVKLSAQARLNPPKLESFYTTDATIEAIAALADASSGFCMIRDELVGWVKAHDAYRQAGDRQTWLSLWSGAPLKIDRKSAPTVFIPTPSVSVTGGLQPDRLADLRDAARTDDGFVDRLLLGWPDAPALLWTDEVVPGEVIRQAQRIAARLRHRADGQRRHVALTRLDDAAMTRFKAWHDDNARIVLGGHGLVAGWAAKYPRQVLRVALVLHALHHPDEPVRPVTVDLIDGAIAVVEYFRSHVPRIVAIFGQGSLNTGSAGLVSRVARILRDAGDRWLSRSNLHAALGRNVLAGEVTAALHQLRAEGSAEQQMVPTEGRAREEWRWRKNESTQEGGPDGFDGEPRDPFGVPAFLRDDNDADPEACCLCGATLNPGRRYLCEACGEEESKRNAALFGEEPRQ